MLVRLSIKNIALIDNIEIDFSKGLNVLSGETGSGKSVILESLNFILGAKADKNLIRSGSNECSVRAEFDISNIDLKSVFEEADIEYEDTLIIFRKFTSDGKSSIKINGTSVTANMLRKFTLPLVDIHGQSEHFYLLQKSNQLQLIDDFCGESLNVIKNNIKNELVEYKNILSKLKNLGGNEKERAYKLDILNYQINEIENFNLQENEEDELIELKSKLLSREKIINALNSLISSISDEGGTDDILSNSTRLLSQISEISINYSSLFDRLENALIEINDISASATSLLNELEDFDANLDSVEERLYGIKSLKKKYGSTLDEINNFLENAKLEKQQLENFDLFAEELIKDKEKFENILYSYYKELSNLRRKHSLIFCENVISELKELNMEKAQFISKFNDFPSIENCIFNSSNGVDDVEFMFSANLGEPLKPLSQVISGGEMSRFMLAIKTQAIKFNNISTFVFDEIDAGISGNVARTVSEKFAKISKCTQILAISHLPQISAMADNNLLIFKSENQGKTTTEVSALNQEEKIQEIIRLIGGDKNSESAKEHAKELIAKANDYKKYI